MTPRILDVRVGLFFRPNSQSFLPYEEGSSTDGDRRYSRNERQTTMMTDPTTDPCTQPHHPSFLNRHVGYPCRYVHPSCDTPLVSSAVEKPESNDSGTLVVEGSTVRSRRANLSRIW